MYKKKISDRQFTLDCINKAYEICNSGRHFNSFEELATFTRTFDKENAPKRWFEEYPFKSKEQYEAWKQYFMEHFYDWKPKRLAKYIAEREFGWFSLNYGFYCDYEKN